MSIKVKNLATKRRVQLGRADRTVLSLAQNATGTFPGEELEDVLELIAQEAAGKSQAVTLPSWLKRLQSPSIAGHVTVDLGTLADGNILTIEGVNFEFDVSGNGVTSGNVDVDGATALAAAPNLKTAINAHASLTGIVKCTDVVIIGTNQVRITLEAVGNTDIADVAVSKTGAPVTVNTAVAAADGEPLAIWAKSITVTAAETFVKTGLEDIYHFDYQLFTAAGVRRTDYDGAILKSGGTLFFDDNGAADLAATNVLHIWAVGKAEAVRIAS